MPLRKRLSRSWVHRLQALAFPTPRHLARNQIHPGAEALATIWASIEAHYYTGRMRDKRNYPPAVYERTVRNKLDLRLDSDRRLIIPWLDATKPLRGSRILEIGCGTGCSTVALLEQGASVVGIDLDRDALAVARDRCRAYGLTAELLVLNADQIGAVFEPGQFDHIIFFASLEHMTVRERLASLRQAWALLPEGGLLSVVETPNRLWYYDGHTALLPWAHWLPDELALAYARFSPRANFRELFSEDTETTRAEFARTGRGMSYHEFDLAIGPDLTVVSSLSSFQGWRYKPQRSLMERGYKRWLGWVAPRLHEGWRDDTLFLILRKD
jgi:2-polyprenyl-3-methyl-5-hydroxy-6-metoxy-1,4-benzoquinol methylase